MFRIEMFPAREGDCLLLTYGDGSERHRVLIDGGRKATYTDLRAHFEKLPAGQRHLELIIVSHIDRDHIEGLLAMFDDSNCPVTFDEVWFNGLHHLQGGDFEEFGPVQGEMLSARLEQWVEQGKCRWNGLFDDAAVALAAGDAPAVTLGGGMKLTVVAPSQQKMAALVPVWERECKDAGVITDVDARQPDPEGYESFAAIDIDALAERPFDSDQDKSAANGSSIAVLAEFDGKRVVLAGDAHVDLLIESIAGLAGGAPPFFNVFKVPHHGSRKNLSKALLQAFSCDNYLVSTNGSYFDHPDPVAMSRLLKYGGPDKHIWFNYRSDETEIWDVPSWKSDYDYELHYPPGANGYQVIEL